MTLQWSDVAAADLDDIYDYIARDVPYYAELFVDQLVSATDRIEAHPRIGRRVPEAGHRDDIRELFVQRYRVIYRVDVDGILILTIVHGSRDLERRGITPWNDM